MPFIRRSRPWQRIAGSATSQEIYLNRRSFLAALGAGAIGAGVALTAEGETISAASSRPGVARKSKFELGRELTDATVAARYNNFYEFGIGKLDPARRAHSLKTTSWTIEIAGLVKQARTLDLDDLLQRMPLEERLYRFRCVEAWALAAPWVGFPLQLLIDQVEPLSSAKFVRFVTADRPDQMPGIKEQPWLPWPYCEALTMAEAANELTLVATGIYGQPLPPQQGAPLRLVVPWKHGYKSIKSIAKIEFVEQQPPTFWHTLQPREYSFDGNIDPSNAHSRWSQSHERLIDSGEILPTQLYNGYGDYVAHLYR